MDGRKALAEAYGAWLDANGWTREQVAAMGGPSTSTTTTIRTTDDSLSRQTMMKIDTVMGWPPGTAGKVSRGLIDPPAPGGPAAEPETVSAPTHDDESTLMYERPKGLSDAEWEKLKTSTGEYIEWQLNRLSQGR